MIENPVSVPIAANRSNGRFSRAVVVFFNEVIGCGLRFVSGHDFSRAADGLLTPLCG